MVENNSANIHGGIGNITEAEFNFALGDSLRNSKAQWSADSDLILVERTRVISGAENSGKRPDILITDPYTPPLVIECSFNRIDAENDAISRLGYIVKKGHRKIKSAISVYIPESFRTRNHSSVLNDLKNEKNIFFALHQMIDDQHQHRRWPPKGFIEGGTRLSSTSFLCIVTERRY